ncbi:MAG: hypothetical protein RLZZ481_803 [Pseudomonadota bacterium]|jgi:hypothetical protein
MKSILALLLSFCTCLALAQDTLCVIQVSNTEKKLTIKVTQDPYILSTLNLDSDFRFSGQVLQDPVTKQSKLKTFVYHESKDRYVLIHASENKLDTATCANRKNATQEFGLHKVYSHKFEHELSYGCKSTCAAGVLQ